MIRAALNARELKSRAHLAALAGKFTKLRRSGKQLVGLCPLHCERHPSFYVHPEKQIFKCFGCGAGGDVFDFVMRATGCDFRRAMEIVRAFLGGSPRERAAKRRAFSSGRRGLPPGPAERGIPHSQFHLQSRAEILAALDETNRWLCVVEAANREASADLDLSTACEPDRGKAVRSFT
jgi:hypothetical protein